MEHSVDAEFASICRSIVSERRTQEEWAEIESDDMFQTENYVGGFDATEMEFCFSVWIRGIEYWFQVSHDDIADIAAGNLTEYKIGQADL